MKKNLQELSNEELVKEAKNTRLVLGMFIGLITVMVISSVITTWKQGINAFTFLPVAFFGLIMLFWANYNKVKKELASGNIQ